MTAIEQFDLHPSSEYSFAGVRFDTVTDGFRTADGNILHLRSQTEQVLRVLASHPTRCVSKEQLFNSVWSDKCVTDDSLVQCVKEIRKALNDDDRIVLKTVFKRGYMLLPDDESGGWDTKFSLIDAEPIRYVSSSDGARIAWTVSGSGISILKAPQWISHLGLERHSKLYVPFYERLGRLARIVRFDQRGTGLSDWEVPPLSLDAMVEDMRAVADAAGIERFVLFGMSQGVAYSIAFAARYPERVLGIIGRGGYARGNIASGRPERRKAHETALAVIRDGWQAEDATYRRFFSSRLMPSGTLEYVEEYDELQRRAVPEENVAKFVEFAASLDVRQEAAKVVAPTLLLHARGDRVACFAEGELLASLMPSARFVPLDGIDHTMVPGSVAYKQGLAEMERFLANYQTCR